MKQASDRFFHHVLEEWECNDCKHTDNCTSFVNSDDIRESQGDTTIYLREMCPKCSSENINKPVR